MFYDANAHRVDDFKRGVEGMAGLRDVLEADDWDAVGIGGLITAYNYIKQAVKTVKKIRPEAKIVAGGGFYSSIPNEMMEFLPELDYGCIGEAYLTFPELLRELVSSSPDVSHVDGVAYRENGGIRFTAPRKLIPDLDWLPFPAYDLAPLDIYFKHSGILMSDEAMRAKKRLDACWSISCPFACSFCFTPETMVQTKDGLTRIDSVKIGDAVLTASGLWKPVEQKHERLYSGKILNLRLWTLDLPIKCTPDHRFYTKRGEVKASELVSTESLEGKRRRLERQRIQIRDYMRAKRRGETYHFTPDAKEIYDHVLIPLPSAVAPSIIDLAEICADLDYGTSVKYIDGQALLLAGGKHSVKRFVPIQPDFARLVGYYLGDGHVHRHKDRPASYTTSFTFNKTEEIYARDVKQLLERYFDANVAITRSGSIVRCDIGSAPIGVFFKKLFGTGSSQKHLPNWCYGLSDDCIRELLVGWLRADGEPRLMRGSTTSIQLATQLFLCAYKAGYEPNLHRKDLRGMTIEGRAFKDPEAYILRFWATPNANDLCIRAFGRFARERPQKYHKPQGIFLPVWRIDEEPYIGTVHNIGVKEIHSYTANLIGVSNCYDLSISWNVEYKQVEGRTEPVVGRPTRKSVVRQHSPKYVAGYVERVRRDFKNIPYGDNGEGADYPVDFISEVSENLVAHDAQTGFTWLKAIRDELWDRGLIAECVSKGVAHDSSKCNGIHFGSTSHAGLATKQVLNTLRETGFTYLDYGLEHWDKTILKNLGKGSSPETNERAIKWTLEAGINPIPNQIVMFEEENFETIKTMLDYWEKTGIVTVPFIMTAYPGSAIFARNRDWVIQQYGGNLEQFIEDLEDATKLTAIVNRNFTPAEAIGIQQILGSACKTGNYRNARRLLWLSEKEWRKRRGLPPEEGAFTPR